MTAALLALALSLIAVQPTPEVSASPPTVTGVCPEGCACPFPGACGHTGCVCMPAAGWKPPEAQAERWETYGANPAWEVFGKWVLVDGRYVFHYTQTRLRKTYRHTYKVKVLEPPNVFRKARAILHRIDLKPGERGLFMETDDEALLELIQTGKVVVIEVKPGG